MFLDSSKSFGKIYLLLSLLFSWDTNLEIISPHNLFCRKLFCLGPIWW